MTAKLAKFFGDPGVKVAFISDGSERRWVRQAVMGVLRWRDLQGSRVSINGSNNNNNNNNHTANIGNLNNNHSGSHHINNINNNNRNEVSEWMAWK